MDVWEGHPVSQTYSQKNNCSHTLWLLVCAPGVWGRSRLLVTINAQSDTDPSPIDAIPGTMFDTPPFCDTQAFLCIFIHNPTQ